MHPRGETSKMVRLSQALLDARMSKAPEPARSSLSSAYGAIEIVDEIELSFGRAHDPNRLYERVESLEGPELGPSRVGILIDGKAMVMLAAYGGATTVHARSALLVGDKIYLAVGNQLACLSLPSTALEWAIAADTGTCFELHAIKDGIISHGELEITRLSFAGEVIWKVYGRDIFTGPFEMQPDWIEARDWNDDLYRIAYDGRVLESPAL